MPTISKNLIRFDARDFLAGLYSQYQTSINALPGYIDNKLLVASAVHPYRSLGYLSPGFNPTDLTTVSVMTGLGRNLALGAEGGTEYAYIICDNNQVNRLHIADKTFSNSGSWPHTIAGAGSETGNDIITYNCNISGTRTACVFYSWNDSGGAWDIGRVRLDTGALDDDFMSTVPATPLSASGNNKPHPMIVGNKDDVLYIGDGNKVHALDGGTGTNGTFYDSVYVLPSGYIVTSFARDPNFLHIFAYYSPSGNSVNPTFSSSGPSISVKWNYLDEDATEVIPLDDNVVTAGFEFQGTVGCFTQGTKPVQEGENRFCTIKLYNGSTFETKDLFVGNAPIHGGVDIVDNSIQWNSDGAVHCWGSPLVGAPSGLNKLGKGAGTSNGLLRTIGGTNGFQMISSGTTTSGGGQYFKVSTFASAALVQTSAAVPIFEPGKIGKVKRVMITYGNTASGGRELAAFLVKDLGSTVQFISAQSTVTSSTLSAQYDRTISSGTFGTFRELSLALQWSAGSGEGSAPVVRSVDVEFEQVNMVGNQ